MWLESKLYGLGSCSAEIPKSKIVVELDTAHATWVSDDVALISTKTGNLLFLSLIYDGRRVFKTTSVTVG